jgi:hypothetical protein
MPSAAVGQAQTEASKKRSEGAASRRQTETADLMLPLPGNQARLRTLAGGAPTQRPSRMPILQRKCGCGGTCADCGKDKLQLKASISEPGDAFEQEADRVAERVMRMPQPSMQGKPETGNFAQPQKSSDAAPAAVPPVVEDALRSPGEPLDAGTRAFMEPRFGRTFDAVRVHTGSAAANSARAMQARAYTVGNRVAFAEGEYAPATVAGRSLLAHELMHVVQQGSQLRRKVTVNPSASAADISGQFNFICPSGKFTHKGGEIVGNCTTSIDQGCECLCDVASDAARNYSITVKAAKASTEVRKLHDGTSVTVPKTSIFPTTAVGSNPSIDFPASSGGSIEFGAFQPDGKPDWASNWRILAHELCGHGRLKQSYAGNSGKRPGHDATIDTENASAAEHGGAARGHFADPRQGESFLNPVGDRSKVLFRQSDGLYFEAP